MKSVLRIIAILLMQTLIMNCAGAQEVLFSPASANIEKDTLSPAIQIDLPGLRDRFLRKVIISALAENDGHVPRTAKATGISPRTIYRLIPREKIAVIAKRAEDRKREIIIRQLEITQGNVSRAARALKIHRSTIQKLTSRQERDALRDKKQENEKQELIRQLKKYCLHAGWLKNTAQKLGITVVNLRYRIRKHGLVVADIKRELELEALTREKGNVSRTAKRLGVTRHRLSKKHREEIEKLRKREKIIEEEKKIFLLVTAIEETRANRAAMALELGVAQSTITYQLNKYGKNYFSVLIGERILLMERLLADIKVRGLKAKEEMNINSLREFLSNSYERVREHRTTRDYPGWLAAWENDLPRKFLPEELLEKIGQYKKIVKRLENVIGDVPRGRGMDMSEGIDKIIKVIDTFYEQNRIIKLNSMAKMRVLVEQAI